MGIKDARPIILWAALFLICPQPASSRPVEMPDGFIRPSGISIASVAVNPDGDLLLSLSSAVWRVELTCRAWVEGGGVEGDYRAKAAVLRERGLIPAVSVGLDGEPFGAISKTLNLPVFQRISLHLAVWGEELRVGIRKRVDLPGVEASLDLRAEGGSGGGTIASARLESGEGAWLGLLYEREGNGFWVEAGFSSEGLMSGVKGAEKLARQAGKLAARALRRGEDQPQPSAPE